VKKQTVKSTDKTTNLNISLPELYCIQGSYQGTNHTVYTPVDLDDVCEAGLYNIADYKNNQMLCCENKCDGQLDDPDTLEQEDLNNSACYDFREALQGMEVKIFWREMQ
jgi:hypothetical protein